MLMSETIEIKIMGRNIKHFNNLGYNVKFGEVLDVKVHDLAKNSKIKVIVECDICKEQKKKSYSDYLIQNLNQNFDVCNKCKSIKSKKTNLEKYGVEHILQRKESLEKFKETMIERYGVENSAYSDSIKEKTRKTTKEKYGVDYITQSEEFKNKSKKTKKERYNNENYNNISKIKQTKLDKYNDENYNNIESSKITNLKKYGFENVSQNQIVKNKKIETSLKNYGVEHPLKSKKVLKQLKNTNIIKLGVPYPMMAELTKEKMYKTNVKTGKWIKYEDRTDFYNYYLLVYKQTLKNKKELLSKWDGNDYYTGKCILENFNLDSNDKNYPTIDHKMSVRFGFDNGIVPEIISDIMNLCITTRSNNSSKGG